MTLPNYFLADLPPEATLSAAMIGDACETLKNNRERYLAARPTPGMIRLLSDTAENWLHPDYPFRQLALDQGPSATGFSRATIAAGLDGFFRQITAANLRALVTRELGHLQRLDGFSATSDELALQRAAITGGPEYLVHFIAGTVPGPAMTAILRGVLLRAAAFVKCAPGASLLPRLFAHSLYDTDGKIGACLEIAEWRDGANHLEEPLFAHADCVTATGSDEMLASIRRRVAVTARFIGYRERVSFAYVESGALSGFNPNRIVARAADDVTAWDQQGGLSPHVIYVEAGGGLTAEQFAEALSVELARREESQPRGELRPETAAIIAAKRAFYEVRAAHSPETRHWCSPESTAWTVVFEADPLFQLSCLHRFIYVKAAVSLDDALRGADSVRGRISTVGLAATEDKSSALATQLARWGATRVCPLGQMPNPPLLWRQDGRPTLADLVTWTDWEQ